MFYAMIIIFSISIIEAIGLTVLKSDIKFSLIFTSIIYGILVVPLLKEGLQFGGIGMVNFIWNIFSTLLVFIIGIYMFDEKIRNKQLIGVCLALAGLFLILVPEN